MEVRGNRLLVNGAPIRVRGINRHDSRILKGRALSADDMREDIVNLRRANVTVIRTSHYPPSPHLLDICDEVGMFVVEQPPICFSGGFDDHHWTRTNEAAQLVPFLLEVTAETVARDQGHASVIVWDLGNESRWGSGFDAQLALVRAHGSDAADDLLVRPQRARPGEPARGPAGSRAPRPPQLPLPGLGPDVAGGPGLAAAPTTSRRSSTSTPRSSPRACAGRARDSASRSIPASVTAWGAGYQPFMEAALGEQGVIGGMIWGGFGEVFAIPLDLTLGEGPWAHLPAADYVRTRDHYPAEPGVFRRGDGDWGIFDAWNRPRPEVWHVHGMYSPIRITADARRRRRRAARGGPGEPVRPSVARGTRHPRVGRPGRGRRGPG